jgi:hypothetical protein
MMSANITSKLVLFIRAKALLLFKNSAAAAAQQVLGNRRRRRALGRARLHARPNLAGCGEVTSPLFSINSILNAK